MLIALIAAGAMVVTDVLGTIMVMAEAANRGWLAGIMDTCGWYVSIATTTISVTTLSGHDTGRKAWVLLFVGAANLFGTKLGQVSGKWLLKRFPVEAAPLETTVAKLVLQHQQLAEQIAELQSRKQPGVNIHLGRSSR